MLLCLLQIVPIFLYLISWYLRCRLHITLLNGSGRMYRGQAHTVILSVEQKGILPIGSATATLVCTNLLSGQSEQMRLCFPIPARNTVQIAVQVIPEHCGMTQIQLAELQIWDYMRLWSRKIRRSAVFTTPAYPMGSPCFAALSNLQTQLTPESNTATSQTIGQDTSELYGIRSYQPGDRMNRIHWKLSSRQDGLLVKEYGTLLQETLQIVLVLPNGTSIQQLDALLETVCTLSNRLLQASVPHTILFYHTQEHAAVRCTISDTEQLWNCLHQVFNSLSAARPEHLLECCMQQIQPGGGATWLLTPDLPAQDTQYLQEVHYCFVTDCPQPIPSGCFLIDPNAIDAAVTAALETGKEPAV